MQGVAGNWTTKILFAKFCLEQILASHEIYTVAHLITMQTSRYEFMLMILKLRLYINIYSG